MTYKLHDVGNCDWLADVGQTVPTQNVYADDNSGPAKATKHTALVLYVRSVSTSCT